MEHTFSDDSRQVDISEEQKADLARRIRADHNDPLARALMLNLSKATQREILRRSQEN